MSELTYICHLEGDLRAFITLESRELNSGYWFMRVKLFYDGEPAGVKTFNLHGYSQQEAEDLAKNLSSNEFLMSEIDAFLWGESD